MSKKIDKMNLEYYLNLLNKEEGGDFCRLAKLVNLDPKTDFAEADLRGVNLTGQNLVGANFQGVDFQDAIFTNAKLMNSRFSYADLRDTDFSYANLENADLSCADLTGAKFGGSVLRRASLRNCQLENADFRGARLDGIDWRDVVSEDRAIFDGMKSKREENNGLMESGIDFGEEYIGAHTDRIFAGEALAKPKDNHGEDRPGGRRGIDSSASWAGDLAVSPPSQGGVSMDRRHSRATPAAPLVPSWLTWLTTLSAIVGLGGFVALVLSPGPSAAILAFAGLMALWYALCCAEDTVVQRHS